MSANPATADLPVIGRALADPSRAAILTALLTGTAWTVGELAAHAGVARSTASEHVGHLDAAGLVHLHRQGRHTYVTLAGPPVASALEALSLVAPQRPAPASLRGQRHARELADGRTCYRHLAGRLGVHLHDRLLESGFVTPDYVITTSGQAWFARLGIDTGGPTAPLRGCLDWTERRPHLAGPLADRLTDHALTHRWIERGTHPRSIRLTPEGEGLLFP